MLEYSEVYAIRKRSGLTIQRLAALLRIRDEKTIRRWEKGDVPVSGPASIILEMLDADELPLRYLNGVNGVKENGDTDAT